MAYCMLLANYNHNSFDYTTWLLWLADPAAALLIQGGLVLQPQIYLRWVHVPCPKIGQLHGVTYLH